MSRNDIVIFAASARRARDFAESRRLPYPIVFSMPSDVRRLRALSRPIVYRVGEWKEMEGDYAEAMVQLSVYSPTYVDVQEW